MAIPFKAQERSVKTRGELNQLRKKGAVPGVVYGKKLSAPVSIAVDEKELQQLLRTTPHALLELEVGAAGKQPVMLTEVQRDPISRSVIHIDFHQVNMNEEVRTQVRVELAGDSAGVREGGILQAMIHELEIHCLPNNIPDAIEVDVSQLQIGENLLVVDLQLPQGVTTKVDPAQVVVTILAPQKELSAEEAAEAEVEQKEAAERAEEANMEDVHTSV
ncbi:50S ribosomal protein L25/general stress protein Ctc [Paenibacillus methanolicus]|uniref:Large ribosomal subunit protein bL25 n=1 Tax=Paenibacillus methanolicus TaxID=582686 RepID=A0A5S5BQZ8_9BACL|nr:50S ribosomal protein L25/general stress protein Ctc [Paenibacillus methanolicus]TYP67993.1 large subunit ribosomal protein L25 [Paenibacillus methanolicus]